MFVMVNHVNRLLTLSHMQKQFDTSAAEDIFENIATNGEIAQNEHVIHLPLCFQPYAIFVTFIEIDSLYLFLSLF